MNSNSRFHGDSAPSEKSQAPESTSASEAAKRSNGKRKKPGPKFFTSDPSKWCMLIKPDGKPCKGLRKGDTGRCSRHQGFNEPEKYVESELPGLVYEAPVSRPAHTIEQVIGLLEQTIDDLRRGRITSQMSNAIAVLCREQARLLETREKFDPTKVATRAYSREAAAALARVMTFDTAKEIIDQKNLALLQPPKEETPNADS